MNKMGKAAPGGGSLTLPALGGLEAAGSSPSVEATVVNVAKVHAHQPEAHSCILYGCELQLHVQIDCHEHVGHVTRQDIASAHGIGWICAQACHAQSSVLWKGRISRPNGFTQIRSACTAL